MNSDTYVIDATYPNSGTILAYNDNTAVNDEITCKPISKDITYTDGDTNTIDIYPSAQDSTAVVNGDTYVIYASSLNGGTIVVNEYNPVINDQITRKSVLTNTIYPNGDINTIAIFPSVK